MLNSCIQNLKEIQSLCERMVPEEYTFHQNILSEASIGQHIRHIIELYQAVADAYTTKIVNYDARKRNPLIQEKPTIAAEEIGRLIQFLEKSPEDKIVKLEGNFSTDSSKPSQLNSSLYRELAYNLEHAIHHQALIKIGLIQLSLQHLIDENFGVAPATIRYRKQQPQELPAN